MDQEIENLNAQKKEQKSLNICIVGKPNAGKSTLLNHIIGEKISIVTPKVQTTRSMITGIVTLDQVQLVLFDTPGIFEPKKKLERAMVRCAWSSLHSADMIVMIIDSSKACDNLMIDIIKRLATAGKPLIFLLNKVDLKSKYYTENFSLISSEAAAGKIFNVSALTGEGINSFINYLKGNAKEQPWLYEEDDLTNLPMRFLAAEITREQLFLKLHQELPYNLTVDSESWQEQADGSVKINQVIIVARDTYKIIILGKNGSQIKEIGTISRANISELLGGKKVHLFLFVKVRKDFENYVQI